MFWLITEQYERTFVHFTHRAGSKASRKLIDACYALDHTQTYGEAVDALKLIPHMLEAFMAGDRGFKRRT
nr:DUF2274 domain-containing protein [Cupriavidus sp. UME77]